MIIIGKAGIVHDRTLDEQQSEEVIGHALNLGINLIDGSLKRLGTDYLDLYIMQDILMMQREILHIWRSCIA